MARKVAMDFTGVFLWHARCIASAACYCARLGETWVPSRLPRWEFTSRWHFLVLGWLKQAALPRVLTTGRLNQALRKGASMPNGGVSCNTRNRGTANKKSIAFCLQRVFAFLFVSRSCSAHVVHQDGTLATSFSQND